MPAEKALWAEKSGYIPLHGATQPPQPAHSRKRRFLRFSAFALLAILGLKTVVHSFGPRSWPPHPPFPPKPHHHLTSEERDKLFLSVPNSESALAASRAYATHPHLAGSSADFEDAKAILELFQTEFGIHPPDEQPIFSAGTPQSRNSTLHLTSHHAPNSPSAWVDVYYPVLNRPLDRSLQILGEDGSAVWTASLDEEGDPLDEDTAKFQDAVPTWHGLSKDGDVEGQLVYANYGTKADYDELVEAGTDLTGKIIITRYGNVFRGLKIKGAQELGAIGVLIYSDTRDDGFVTVENGFAPYPAGPARNPTSVQRGSVQYLSSYPGDPTTPGKPAYENVEREEATNIPKIPSLPISWTNGQRLLQEIGELYVTGKDGKRTLSGKASASKIKLVNHVDTKVIPIWNTMAAIPGHIRDEVVIIGCHRDAWVLGAADPTSGTVSLHEIIRGFGALVRNGWKPLRTIVFASWDAEEYGLIGSTEWGEDFAEWISQHAVAYLNTDTSSSGSRFNVGASPSLANLIKQIALELPHPTEEGKNLWDARNDEGPFKATSIDAEFLESYEAAKRDSQASGIRPLGSGSDYTVFLQRLGVASSDEGFGVTPSDAVYHYHSVFDSQRFQEVYVDPGFHRHVAVAKHLGLLALRLSDSFLVPLNTTQYALELNDYLAKITALQAELPSTLASLDLSDLSKAIKKVQHASLALDKEKFHAEKDFKRILHKLRRHHPFPRCRKSSRFLRRVKDWIKGIFGVKPHNYESISKQEDHQLGVNAWTRFLRIDGEDVRAVPPHLHHMHGHHGMHRKPAPPVDGPKHPCPHKPRHSRDGPPQPKHWHEDGPGHGHPSDHPGPHHSDEGHDHSGHEHPKPDLHRPHHPHEGHDHPEHKHPEPDHRGPHHPNAGHDHPEHRHSEPGHHGPKHGHHGPEHIPKEIMKLIKAAKRIVKTNKKIIAFERGFISEGGIKDREWYKHLGVAPGKWLGYGATTFPALTEALVFDKNATLAEFEAERLANLLNKLAHTIEP